MTRPLSTDRPATSFVFTCVSAVLLFVLMSCNAMAQTVTSYSSTTGSTPSNLAPGTPAGSFALSGFDKLNPFNGGLSFNLPLLSIGGRGSAGYTMSLPIERKWRVNKTIYDPNPPCPQGGCEQYFIVYGNLASSDWWYPQVQDFRPGIMGARWAGYELITDEPCPDGTWQRALTRLSFISANGTETVFIDKLTGGKPLAPLGCSEGAFRGKVFESIDGSSKTFISDVDIYDVPGPVGGDAFGSVSGYLLMRDGTRYRIEDGQVSWIRDRNGNVVRFSQGKVTDSLNREVNITNGGSGWAPYKQIEFKGADGTQRTIRVQYDTLSNALRPANGGHPAETIRNHADLFPGILDWGEYYHNGGVDFQTQVVSSVVLPDGRSYRFFYNSYGELARVELPTGGAFEYDWSGEVNQVGGGFYDGPSYAITRRVDKKRVYKEGNALESEMTIGDCLNTTVPAGNSCRQVDQRDGNDNLLERTRHFYHGVPVIHQEAIYYSNWNEGREYKTESLGADGTTVLRKVETTWEQRPGTTWWQTYQLGPRPPRDPRTTLVTTTLADTGQVSLKSFGYDDSLPFNNQSDVFEYDFGPGTAGALLRHTHTDYVTSANYVGTNSAAVYAGTEAHLRSLPSQQWVSSDASGTTKQSFTTYEYDNYQHDYTHDPLTPRTDISGLCTTFSGVGQNNVCSNTNPTAYTTRGNTTSVTSYANAANQTSPVTVAMQYDVAGNMVKFLEPRSIASGQYYSNSINYADCYGAPDGNARTPTAPSELSTQSQQSYAFVTSVTNPLEQTTYSQYNYYLGVAVDGEDINGVVASGFYNDLLGRPTQVILANNIAALRQQKTIIYDDTNRVVTVTSDLNTFGDNKLKSNALFDGLGRAFETHTYESNDAFIISKQVYDGLGRVVNATNPYRTLSDPTYGETLTTYDTVGRVTKIKTTPDNAEVVTTYSGNTVTVTDQAGKQRKSVTDALGRLTSFYEAPNDTTNYNFQTGYVYDVLGNLRTVTQGTQKRYFLYDSLSRLIRARNPEQEINSSLDLSSNALTENNSHWALAYSYDENGNLLTKTDARGTQTSFLYDELSRVTQRSYSGGTAVATPAVAYTYDTAGIPNSKGRLTSVSSSVSVYSNMGFDALGRITSSQQLTDGQTYSMSYVYDLVGNMTSQTYPTGRIVTSGFDNAGRLVNISGQASGATPKTYANSSAYTPHGALERMRLSNGRWLHTNFNTRMQLTEIGVGTSATDSSVLKLNYEYGSNANNGSVLRHVITVPTIGNATGFIATQNYQYDQLNRVAGVQEINGNSSGWQTSGILWQQKFSFDRYGNRAVDTANTTSTMIGPNPEISTTSNRIVPRLNPVEYYFYDKAGNMTKGQSEDSFYYDAENKLVQYQGGAAQSGGADYTYDGDGRRVKKATPAETRIFVYNISGQLVAEYTTSTADNNGTSYFSTDNLGSLRVITKSDGSVRARHDYLPFGEELYSGVGNRTGNPGQGYDQGSNPTDKTRQKFTLKERDDETGLDYFLARYYSSTQGRFTSVDPEGAGARVSDPRSWNGYAYAGGNPVMLTDPDGQEFLLCDPDGKNCVKMWDDDFYEGRKKSKDEGFIFTGDEDFFESGRIKAPNGDVLFTYIQISIDDQVRQAVFAIRGAVNPIPKATLQFFGLAAVLGTGGGALAYYVPAALPILTVERLSITGPSVGITLLSNAQNPSLRNLINYLYRAAARIGSGSTADAIRYERATGRLLSPAGHSIKGRESIVALERLINSGKLNPNEVNIAKFLVNDLKDALK